jgi:hypothetical protein
MMIIGIDPGKTGGMAWIQDGKAYCFSFKDKDEYEIGQEFAVIACCGAKAFLEKVHSAPGQGVASTFAFGRGYGFLRGLLVANKIPFEDITPQEWQRGMRVPTRGNKTKAEHKNVMKQRAKQLYPSAEGIDLTTADAVLLAHYGASKIFNGMDI